MIPAMTPKPRIDWTAGLPTPRALQAHESQPNQDKRYAMTISPASLREASGRIRPLLAQTSTGAQARA
jgi:hypothetical protein